MMSASSLIHYQLIFDSLSCSMFDQMIEMGVPEELVLGALKQTDNSMVAAINMIQNEPELLIESPSQTPNDGRAREIGSVPLNDEVSAVA